MMRRLLLSPGPALAFACLVATPAMGQVRAPGSPITDQERFSGEVPVVVMESPDVERMKAEDAATDYRPLRYGAVLKTTLASDFAGRWDVTADGEVRVWRIAVQSPGAYTIGLTFDVFRLPPGAQVFLYTPDKSEVLGAYTDANVNPNGQLAVEPVAGDTVVVEYVLPEELVDEAPALQIGEVVHDYRNLRDLLYVDDDGSSGSPCLVDINCPEGANHQDVKKAVMRTLSNGVLCSASLLTSADKNGVQYMLTANHCGSMTNGVFLFNYERPGCGTGSAPSGDTVSGATQLAASSTYDSQLYRINNPIPASYGVVLAGWSRVNSTVGPAVSIGHGGGSPKQIAIDNNGASLSGSDYQVFWNTGILIGGNSGGPLFDGNKRVIGPACCVSSFTCGNQTAWYGRFSGFWGAGNLAQWLDPAGTGVTVTDLFDPNGGTGPSCGSTFSYGQGCPGTWGFVPSLGLTGCFSPGGAVDLSILGGLGGSTALVFFGLNQAATPMGAGCTLNVSPLLPIMLGPLPLATGFPGQGAITLHGQIPVNAAPGTVTMQVFIPDAAATAGFSNTNGQSMTILP